MIYSRVDQVWRQHMLHAVGWVQPLANKLSPESRTVPCWRHTPLWKSFSQELLLCVAMWIQQLYFADSSCSCFISRWVFSVIRIVSFWSKSKRSQHWLISKPHLFDVRGNWFQLLDEELAYCHWQWISWHAMQFHHFHLTILTGVYMCWSISLLAMNRWRWYCLEGGLPVDCTKRHLWHQPEEHLLFRGNNTWSTACSATSYIFSHLTCTDLEGTCCLFNTAISNSQHCLSHFTNLEPQ